MRANEVPYQARRLLEGTTPGPWEWASCKDNDVEYDALRGPGGVNALRTQDAEEYASWICGTPADKVLAAAAPALATTLAGMTGEYAIAYLDKDGNITLLDEGYKTLDDAQHRRDHLLAKVRPHTKIMRRPVGPWEEVK